MKPLNVLGRPLIITQLADDTTIFIKNADQIPLVIKKVEIFSKASGLQLNLKKCELMALHEHPNSDLHGIPVKTEVKYLGIILSKDWKRRELLNIENNITKTQPILNSWLQRDLYIFGRILITKSQALSRFIYPAFSL